MEYYLSHTSALQIYRALRTRRHELLTHGFNEYLNKFNLDARQLLTKDDIPYRDLVRAINDELLVDYGIELKNPVEITVSNKKNSCVYEGIHFHCGYLCFVWFCDKTEYKQFFSFNFISI